MKTRQLKGFTLVELLVVITILALLVALLLPALTAVKEQMNAMKCRTYVRQLYVGFEQYVMDEGCYPTDGASKDPTGPTTWQDRILRYLLTGQETVDAANKKKEITRCPTAATIHSNHTEWSFMMNDFFLKQSQPCVFGAGRTDAMGLPTERQSKTILAGDGHWPDPAVSGDGTKWIGINCDDNPPDFEHRGMSNFLFCDGHVDSLNKQKASQKYLWSPTEPMPGNPLY